MRFRVFVPFFILVLAGCERAPPEPQVTVEHAVVTLPAVAGRPGAAYFMLRTNNDPTRLTGIASPKVGRIELHETREAGGMSRMASLDDTIFSPGHPLAFEPAGKHAMLFDIDPTVRVGATIPLTFRFELAPPVTVEAEVRRPGDAGQAGR